MHKRSAAQQRNAQAGLETRRRDRSKTLTNLAQRHCGVRVTAIIVSILAEINSKKCQWHV
jgi:hypothetical protein